jgi:hypothetical protein
MHPSTAPSQEFWQGHDFTQVSDDTVPHPNGNANTAHLCFKLEHERQD